MTKTTVGIRLRPSWTESYLESLVDKAVDMQIFISDNQRGTIGLDPGFHELMGEMLDWFLSTGQRREADLKSEDIAGVIGKYVVGDSRVIPTKEDLGKAVSEFNIMIKDKTFQDMCHMIRDFIVNATAKDPN